MPSPVGLPAFLLRWVGARTWSPERSGRNSPLATLFQHAELARVDDAKAVPESDRPSRDRAEIVFAPIRKHLVRLFVPGLPVLRRPQEEARGPCLDGVEGFPIRQKAQIRAISILFAVLLGTDTAWRIPFLRLPWQVCCRGQFHLAARKTLLLGLLLGQPEFLAAHPLLSSPDRSPWKMRGGIPLPFGTLHIDPERPAASSCAGSARGSRISTDPPPLRSDRVYPHRFTWRAAP